MGAPPNEPEPLNWPLRGGMWAAGISQGFPRPWEAWSRFSTGKTPAGGRWWMWPVWGVFIHGWYAGHHRFTWEKSRPRIGVLDFILYPYGHWKCKDGFVPLPLPATMTFAHF
jgi:hypothetical protein